MRAASLIQLLRSLHHLLSLVLTPSVGAAEKVASTGHVDLPDLQQFVTQLLLSSRL